MVKPKPTPNYPKPVPTTTNRLATTPQGDPLKSLSKIQEIAASLKTCVNQANKEIEKIKKQHASAVEVSNWKLKREEEKNAGLTKKVTSMEREMEGWKDNVHAEKLVSNGLKFNLQNARRLNYNLHNHLTDVKRKHDNKVYWMGQQINKLQHELQTAVKGRDALGLKVTELTSTSEQQATEIVELKKQNDHLAHKLQEDRNVKTIEMLMQNNQQCWNQLNTLKVEATKLCRIILSDAQNLDVTSGGIEGQHNSPKRKMNGEECGSNNTSKAQKVGEILNGNGRQLVQAGPSRSVDAGRAFAGDNSSGALGQWRDDQGEKSDPVSDSDDDTWLIDAEQKPRADEEDDSFNIPI